MRALRGWLVWWFVFAAYAGTRILAGILGGVVRRGAAARVNDRTLLVTGRFFSGNWSRSHLLPLANSTGLRRVVAVVDGPVAGLPEKVELRRSPRFLQIVLGRNLSRALTTFWLAMRLRPDAVMGYHLFPAGMAALIAARLCGARAIYQSTGGPTEIIGGGSSTENAILSRLNGPSPALERLAMALSRMFDAVIVRGRNAREYFEKLGAAGRTVIIPGSIDTGGLAAAQGERNIDFVFVGRLTEVKQPEQVVQIAAMLRATSPELRVVLAGDGPMRAELEAEVQRLALQDCVSFAGHVEDVAALLGRSRVFVLTSRSEGLSIAMAEAMAAGCVPVVADVGDLGELVENGVSGWRVPPGRIDEYADRIRSILADTVEWERLSQEARRRAVENNGVEAVAHRWDELFVQLDARLPRREPVPA
jgi:glycosyltransferase involved in cell wall biosynthesis